MKTPSFRKSLLIKTPGVFASAACLSLAFWAAMGSNGLATPNQCPVCHKGTTTLILACNSLEYQRHLDHGDPAMACAATSSDREAESIRKKE